MEDGNPIPRSFYNLREKKKMGEWNGRCRQKIVAKWIAKFHNLDFMFKFNSNILSDIPAPISSLLRKSVKKQGQDI